LDPQPRRFADLPAHFTGYLSGDALATAYASEDVFAFASDTDTFGQVILEAMASRLPVVAARAGGAVDLVEHGDTGFLFTPGSSAELRSRLAALVGDAALRARLGAEGRRSADCRSWPQVMEELLAHYRQATALAPTPTRIATRRAAPQAAITR
jgi:phosphatidylinositol alpha 1,6-mannosyltransferase